MVYEDFEYKRIDSGIEIKKYTGSATSVIIPKYIDDLSVTSIGERAFEDCKSLTSIQIPNSVTSIGDSAFEDCKSLTSIQIPNSVTSIGELAFWHCESLTSIQIPNSVTSIGRGAFSDCKSLTSIQIPNSVTSIGEDAFKDCSPSLKILRGSIAEPVVKATKTTVDSHYNQEEKSAEEISSDKGPPVIGCLFWIVVLLFILNFLFG